MDFGKPAIDVNKLRAFKDKVVSQLTSGTGQLGEGAEDQVPPRRRRRSRARRRSTWRWSAGGTEQVTFGHAIIAVGSQPAKVPGLVHRQPARDGLDRRARPRDVPKTLLVVGGGYIGLELGSVYAALGSKVTVVEMTPGLLPGADRDLVAVLAEAHREDLRGGAAEHEGRRRWRSGRTASR